MSYLFLVKASANEFSEMVLKLLEIGHFLRNVGLCTELVSYPDPNVRNDMLTDHRYIHLGLGTRLVCINLTELLLIESYGSNSHIGFVPYHEIIKKNASCV